MKIYGKAESEKTE